MNHLARYQLSVLIHRPLRAFVFAVLLAPLPLTMNRSWARDRYRFRTLPLVLLGAMALLGFAGSSMGEPLFAAAFLSFDVGEGLGSLAVEDLNGDEKPDLVTTDGYAVFVQLGNGDGTFEPKVSYSAGGGARSVAIGDLSGDGRPDLAVTNFGLWGSGNTVSVLFGNGDGTFGAKTDYGTGTGPRSVALGDLNGDGRPDLAVTNVGYSGGFGYGGGNTVSVLLGNGDGTFGVKTDYETGINPFSIAIDDLNGDGKGDLVTGNVAAYTVSVLLGNGDGTFGGRTDYAGGLLVAVRDLNGDGKVDLVTTQEGWVSVLLGNGDGTFGAKADYGAGSSVTAIAIGDLNDDAKADVVAAHVGTHPNYVGTVSVLLGNGDGTFGAGRDCVWGGDTYAWSLVIEDLNGNGMPDLMVASPRTVSVLLGNGDGTFGAAPDDYGTGAGPRRVAMGDLNRDRKLDLVTANTTGIGVPPTGSVSVLLGNGDGSFGTKTDYETGSGPCVAIGDLDADGKPDLVVGSTSAFPVGVVSILRGNGDGTFGARTDYDTGTRPTSVAIADLNGDGKLDVATANAGVVDPYLGTFSVLLGNGDGTLGAKLERGIGFDSFSLAIGDWNRDAKADLAVAGYVWYGGYCGGCSGPFDSVIGVLEEAEYYAGKVAVLLGNGDGTFRVQTDYQTGANTSDVATGDLNLDRRPDLVTSGEVSVLLGNGDGTFGIVDHGTSISADAVAVDDLNGDGWPDLAMPSASRRRASVLLGNGDGTFGVATGYGIGERPAFVSIGDLNGDRKPDLVTANYSANTVSVLLNIGPEAPPFEVTVDLDPHVINLASRAPWLTAYIEPSGFDPGSIDISTLRLAGSVPTAPKFTVVGDHDGNSVADLMVKFSREALDPLLTAGVNELAVTGLLVTGEQFEGKGGVRVIDPPGPPLSATLAPNPLNPAGVLTFRTSGTGRVRVAVFDAQGRVVRVLLDTPVLPAGSHTVPVDGRGSRGKVLASGVYFYRVEATEGSVVGRIAILK